MAPPGGDNLAGLYERLLTEGLAADLRNLDEFRVERDRLHEAEAPDRIALHLARQIESILASVPDKLRVEVGVDLARVILEQVGLRTSRDVTHELPVSTGEMVRSVMEVLPDGSPRPIERPLVPLLDTTLLTNSPGEPRIGRSIAAEIDSADEICVVMAFIRRTGIKPLLSALEKHTQRGRPLRVLTTVYTGSTERSALDQLRDLGADIKVSYDVSTTRLHAKAWLFERHSGYSTVYVGSSNLTHSAQVTGLEWNVRASAARNPDVVDKVRAVFESYWEHHDFITYDSDMFSERTASTTATGPTIFLSPIAVTPLHFQERLLELIEVSRNDGHHRNLLVSATGTGKTVMAALDYARLQERLPRARLLFIAHRQEILDQSQATFRHVLRDPNFGEQWIGGQRPTEFDHVFASIQTLNRIDLGHLDPQHFDVVVIDEFHHAAAASYQAILDHLRPHELLGLTATPERSDGLPILHWFGDRIAAELRLWDAIDQQYLVPFAYYGIHDGLDLRDVPWSRSTGYDVEGLTNLYTASDHWAKQVITEMRTRVDDLSSCRALGFCVSVDHARFMARIFEEAGIPAVAVWGATSESERRHALSRLASGDVTVVFSVDLFNEGVDVPNVDTLLLLRPTESPTLFLQQLGRGLRRAPGKSLCTVLDFVGLHRQEFRFDRRLSALLGGTRRSLEQQIQKGFPYLPAGCHMELDRKASEIVLASIRSAIPSKWPEKVAELRRCAEQFPEISLSMFLQESGLDLHDIYHDSRSWSDLREAAGLPVLGTGPSEKTLRRAIRRLSHIDDARRLDFYADYLSSPTIPDIPHDAASGRLVRMLISQLVGEIPHVELPKDVSLEAGLHHVWKHPQVVAELQELVAVLRQRIDHVHRPLPTHAHVPLQVHARYTRLEILAAFGHGAGARVTTWQAGVLRLDDEAVDLFAFTLDKTTGHFSPTTRYRDYAISPTLIHWESQSSTRANSPTGLRYQHHADMGSAVVMFARLRQEDRAFWCLGEATYVRHQGEQPMAIVWRLANPLPGDLFTQFAAAAS